MIKTVINHLIPSTHRSPSQPNNALIHYSTSPHASTETLSQPHDTTSSPLMHNIHAHHPHPYACAWPDHAATHYCDGTCCPDHPCHSITCSITPTSPSSHPSTDPVLMYSFIYSADRLIYGPANEFINYSFNPIDSLQPSHPDRVTMPHPTSPVDLHRHSHSHGDTISSPCMHNIHVHHVY